MKVVKNIIELIGNTPMIKLDKFTQENEAEIYAKLEWYNPGGSIKDRTVKYLIEYAEACGKLDKNKIILEATSGNTGIALAMIAAVKGYKAKIIMVTSHGEQDKVIKAIQNGASNYILKPVKYEKLEETINKLFV